MKRLEPILLREPENQKDKWLAAPQGVANRPDDIFKRRRQ